MLEVTCPSGLAGKLRGLCVKDEQLLTDAKLWRSGRMINALMDACWVETTSPGPYKFGATVNWDDVLQADRLCLFVKTRVASYGPEYAFKLACEACKRRVDWTQDLDEIEVVPVGAEALEAFREGRPLVTQLPEGRVHWRMFVGRDEQWLLRLREEDREHVLVRGLTRRLVKVEVPNGVALTASEERPLRAWVEGLSVRSADALRDEIDAAEGGLVLDFDLECPQCSAVQTVALPFDQGFFSARKSSSRRSTRRSGGESTSASRGEVLTSAGPTSGGGS